MDFSMQCSRRGVLQMAALASVSSSSVLAQSAASGVSDGPTVVQIADMSATNIDVSKDFVIGARAAFQDLQRKGAWRGKPVQLQMLEVDGTPNSLKAAMDSLRSRNQVVGVLGSVGDRAASQIAQMLPIAAPGLAHIAPWLHNAGQTPSNSTFSIFATRQAQIAHALKSLAAVGVNEFGAVFASQQEFSSYRAEVEAVALTLGVRCTTFPVAPDLQVQGQKLAANTPRILVFLGGTPELVQFAQGIGKQATQRYIVAMSDVSLQTLQQMGTPRNAAVIVTQVVPLVNSNLPVVRSFRDTLSRLFDEPPTPHSLAGFVAARYCYEVLNGMDGALTRATVLQAFQRRGGVDLGGLTVDGQPGRSTQAFVTQSMLSADGRLVG